MYVLEGPSESVGKTDLCPSPCTVQVQSLRWPASTRRHTQYTCRWSNTVSNEALLTVLPSREGARLRWVEWDVSKGIHIPYPVSGVDLWQGSNPVGSQWVTMCCVRRQGSIARVYGSRRLRSIPLLYLFLYFNSMYILCSYCVHSMPVYFPGISFLNNEARMLTGVEFSNPSRQSHFLYLIHTFCFYR